MAEKRPSVDRIHCRSAQESRESKFLSLIVTIGQVTDGLNAQVALHEAVFNSTAMISKEGKKNLTIAKLLFHMGFRQIFSDMFSKGTNGLSYSARWR